MMNDAHTPQLLLVHDGELPDIRQLLDGLGTPFVERRGDLQSEDHQTPWDVVVATPRRILDLHHSGSGTTPIAIVDQDTRTMRNSLKRAGIRLVVRRPVHPSALRALILHSLYRGPERRRSRRVSVGAPVRARAGWRSRPAVLADLSLGGCRLLCDTPIERGQAFTLSVPGDLSGDKAISLKARVLECENGPPEADASQRVITARFENVASRQLTRLKQMIRRFEAGPASFAETGPPPGPEVPEAGEEAPAALEESPHEEPTAPSIREALRKRMAALDEEAGRVLVGRDLSVSGMRVEANPQLALGMEIQLAVHVEDRPQPLALRARVHRDEGDQGLVLRFFELGPENSRYLNDRMDELPMADGDGGLLVTEIVATA